MSAAKELTRSDILTGLLELPGVASVAIVSSMGELLESRSSDEQDLEGVFPSLSNCLASGRVLAELLGEDTPTQMVLEFASGERLLTRRVETPSETFSVVALTTSGEVDRVSFSLRLLLPQLAA